jgi:hypothetical protein
MSLAPRRSLRRTTTVAAVAAVGLISTGLVGTAQAANTTVTGTVRTSAGTAVAGATVTIKVGTKTPVLATTNSSGAFSVATQTGGATIELTSPTAAVAGLPQSWAFKGVGTTIASGANLAFTLPATTNVAVKVQRSKALTGIPGARITQCLSSTSAADPHVVLPGSAAVAPTQGFTGAVTDATGAVTLKSFKDTTLGRLCAGFVETTGGATTTYAARGPIRDASVDTAMNIFAPQVLPQAGTVRDSTAAAKAGVKVAIRSAGGQLDSASAPTTANGAFSTQVAPGSVFARISSQSLSGTVAPPTNIPRAFKATIDGTSDGIAAWNINLPATVTLSVKVINPDGTPVENAVIRPLTIGAFDSANAAGLVAGQPNALITQQIYGDSLSNNLGITSARLFPDSSVGAFTVTKNIGGGLSRTTTVAAGTVLTSSTQITVTLPLA